MRKLDAREDDGFEIALIPPKPRFAPTLILLISCGPLAANCFMVSNTILVCLSCAFLACLAWRAAIWAGLGLAACMILPIPPRMDLMIPPSGLLDPPLDCDAPELDALLHPPQWRFP